ncbi:MAG: universal stress protein [Nannocystis sp.]|nr:universal stress protein [Nannocystis sp.]
MLEIPTLRSILVADDFSENASKALDLAADLARRYSAALTILHVYANPGIELPTGFIPWEHELARVLKAVTDALDRHRQRAEAVGVANVHTEAIAGHPYETIMQTVERGAHDLLVMGYQGRSDVRRMLIGSVTERVLRSAPCSILTVL